MMIKIGEKIKLLRKKNDVTQDRLAEYLGVTAQAISRWESEICYPDLEMLPSIASFFGVSIDELLCYDKSEQEQNKIIIKVKELLLAGRSEEALAEARRGLALYPQNHAIAVSLVAQIFNNASAHNTSIDESERKAMLEEGIALCQRVLRDCPGGNDENDMLRLGAKIQLVHMLCKAERREEAVGIAQMMPLVSMSQEIIMQSVLTGEERIKYSLAVMPLLIVMITSSFLNNLTYPDKDKSIHLFEYTAEDCLRDISVWDIFYAPIDKTDGGAAKRSNWVYMFLHQRAAKAMLEAGDKSSSVEYFRRAVECLPYVNSDSANFKYNNTNFAFNLLQRKTIVSSDPLCLRDGNNYTGRSSAYVMLHGYIENGYYNGLEEESGYAEALERLKKMC